MDKARGFCHVTARVLTVHPDRGPGHIAGAAQLPALPSAPPFFLSPMQRDRGEQGLREEAKHPS